MHMDACIGRHLKETVLWGTITWSKMGKQNTQAEKSIVLFQDHTHADDHIPPTYEVLFYIFSFCFI